MPGRTKATAMIKPPASWKSRCMGVVFCSRSKYPLRDQGDKKGCEDPCKDTDHLSFPGYGLHWRIFKIMGMPPATAPRKKKHKIPSALVVKSQLIPLENKKAPLPAPAANQSRNVRLSFGYFVISLTCF